jgi:HNH endonuclease
LVSTASGHREKKNLRPLHGMGLGELFSEELLKRIRPDFVNQNAMSKNNLFKGKDMDVCELKSEPSGESGFLAIRLMGIACQKKVKAMCSEISPPPGSFPIPGYENYYADGNGLIWSRPRQGGHKTWNPVTPGDHNGYLRVGLRSPKKKSPLYRFVHKLVLLAFKGNPPLGKEQCCHINGDKKNNRPENLCWGDPRDQAADRERHGTSKHGERATGNKLKVEYVRDLRRRYESGEEINAREEARAKGVKCQTIRNVLTRKSWRKDDDSVRRKQQSSPICEPVFHEEGKDISPVLEELRGLWRRLTEHEQQKFLACIEYRKEK